MDEETDWEALKMALNNAIWMHSPPETTLKLAEEAALTALSILGGVEYEMKIKL